jgi:hypothetical protein
MATRVNASVWWRQPLAGAIVVALIVVFAAVWRRRGRWAPQSERWVDRLIIASPAVIPLVWYELLKNHSQVHVWFTYRSIPLVIGIVAAAAVIGWRPIGDAASRSDARASSDSLRQV